jgi:RNase H-fold protein (predicted Holliday junction resolvase)
MAGSSHLTLTNYIALARDADALIAEHAHLLDNLSIDNDPLTQQKFARAHALNTLLLINFRNQHEILVAKKAETETIDFVLNMIKRYEKHDHIISYIRLNMLPQTSLGTNHSSIQSLSNNSAKEVKLSFELIHPRYSAQEMGEMLKKEKNKKRKKEKRARKKIKLKAQKAALKGYDTNVSRAYLFPTLAITCGLSKKTKNAQGSYIHSAPDHKSSYHTLHIIADYMNLVPQKNHPKSL